MIGLDTNVLLRFIVQDDAEQSPRATKFLATLTPELPGFIGIAVLLELCWTLGRGYKTPRADVLKIMRELDASGNFVFERHASVLTALFWCEENPNADFADCLVTLCASLAGCPETVTFDKIAAQLPGMRLLG